MDITRLTEPQVKGNQSFISHYTSQTSSFNLYTLSLFSSSLIKISFPSVTKPSNSKHTCPYALGLFVVNLSSGILPIVLIVHIAQAHLFLQNQLILKYLFVMVIKGWYLTYLSYLHLFLLQINLQMKFDSLHLFLSND